MRVLLLGDSHLARIQPDDLTRIAAEVTNAAISGSFATDLADQVAGVADLASYDVVVIGVGTNDAAPWKQVPIETSERALADAVVRLPQRIVYVASPGVDETRLKRVADRTNEVLADYSRVAADVVAAAGGSVVDTPAVLASLGSAAFVDDGVHLAPAAYELLIPAIAAAVG
ncbi:SGNH/GDSL hydrolase family protein [Nocardioides sp. InS609-2]|uniref:SGNH/GDSL hydrolase family protein n=1 Tax=Nocardioides sp. InS609-2 TaxID=2760705 RepID=UPI0017F0D051|nr:SGNH/GDSL hydrolase family protein [Nocardioides sp. InS609-2]MBA3783183.1 SGNH/GDSL hydrolase family protein [Nocardioides sp.]